MRRVAILVALVALDMWLIAGSARNGEAVGPASLASMVSAQEVCCPPGTGNYPHWGWSFGQCVQLYECGFNQCTPFEGCDPIQEWQCVNEGWTWDPDTCTCNPPGCNPAEQEE